MSTDLLYLLILFLCFLIFCCFVFLFSFCRSSTSVYNTCTANTYFLCALDDHRPIDHTTESLLQSAFMCFEKKYI